MKLPLVLALTVLSSGAAAQGRPSTTVMTCQAAHALVVSQRAIVLNTGGDTYDRYVSDQGACPRGLITRPGFVRTADNPQCMVGYLCVDESFEENR
jgi:hypothetical protein